MKVGVRMLGAGAALFATAGALAGTISDPVIQVQASSSLGSGTLNVPFIPGNYDPVTGEYRWSLAEPVDITADGGGLIATIESLSTFLMVDPLVNVGFVATAGPSDVTITITSALIGFTPISPASGTASAQLGLTDNDGNGGTLTGNHAGGLGFRADYNGVVPTGTTFATLVPTFSVGMFGSDNRNGNVPLTGIGPAVSNMSSQYSFTFTANDSASGTSVFVVIPEPASLALLALGGLALIRRR